jgi:hypothetical protein
MITIGRYKNTRHWAVWKEKELVAVVCYKKGAKTIKQILTDLLNKPADDNQSN